MGALLKEKNKPEPAISHLMFTAAALLLSHANPVFAGSSRNAAARSRWPRRSSAPQTRRSAGSPRNKDRCEMKETRTPTRSNFSAQKSSQGLLRASGEQGLSAHHHRGFSGFSAVGFLSLEACVRSVVPAERGHPIPPPAWDLQLPQGVSDKGGGVMEASGEGLADPFVKLNGKRKRSTRAVGRRRKGKNKTGEDGDSTTEKEKKF